MSKPLNKYVSVAVIGGTKIEKITKGFKLFSHIYDFVIPCGCLLNNIMKISGFGVGDSYFGEDVEESQRITKKILENSPPEKILLPDEVIIAKKCGQLYKSPRIIKYPQNIPKGYAIVDLLMSLTMKKIFDSKDSRLRVLVAGTPSLVQSGFSSFVEEVLYYFGRENVEVFMMGGNTLEDINLNCKKSTGGGASLYYMSEKTCPVLSALKLNQSNWRFANVF